MLKKKVQKVSSTNSTGFMNVMGGKFSMNGSPLGNGRGDKSAGRFP